MDTAQTTGAPTEDNAMMPENQQASYQLPEGAQELIDKFNPGSDTSTPEATAEALLKIVKDMAPFYDKSYDLAQSSPEVAGFMNDMTETGNVAVALAKNFDPDELQAAIEEAKSSDMDEHRQVYSDKVAAVKSQKETREKNQEVSMKDISDFMEQRSNWPAEKADAFEKFVIDHYQDGLNGKINKENLELLEKAFNYDDDVAEAEDNGKVMGKNEKIVAQKMSKEDTNKLLPEGGVGASTPVREEKPKSFGAKFLDGIV